MWRDGMANSPGQDADAGPARPGPPRRLRAILPLAAIPLAILFLLAMLAEAVATPWLGLDSAQAATVALPPLPHQLPSASTSIDGVVDRFPLVVRTFPDQASTAAATELAGVNPLDAAAVAQTISDAWAGLVSPDGSGYPDLRRQLLSAPDTFYGGDAGGFATVESADFPALANDPRNADRLSNLGVALFTLSVAQDQGAPLPAATVTSAGQLARTAEWLLFATYRHFSARYGVASATIRAAVINLAWQRSIGTAGIPAAEVPDGLPASVDLLQAWLGAHPTDREARSLLANRLAAGETSQSIRSTPTTDAALTSAMSVLQPLLADAATAAWAHSAAADVCFTAALHATTSAPYHARTLALAALDHVDTALQSSSDPGLYAGRARFLSWLGDQRQARESADLAVAQTHGAPEALLVVSAVDEAAGDFAGMRATALRAQAQLSGRRPSLASVRFLGVGIAPWMALFGGMATLGAGAQTSPELFSFRSTEDHITVWQREASRGAGGAFLVGDVPRTRDEPFAPLRQAQQLLDQAAIAALQASVVLADPSGADREYALWQQLIANPTLGGDPSQPIDPSGQTMQTYLQQRTVDVSTFAAAAHVSGGGSTANLQAALTRDTILREAGRFSDDVRAWAQLAPSITDPQNSRVARERLAEAQYLAGAYTDARTTLSGLYTDPATQAKFDNPYFQDLVATDQRLGLYDDASRVIDSWAKAGGLVDYNGFEKRGEMALLRGDAVAAVMSFTSAVAALVKQYAGRTPVDAGSDADFYVHAESNLGIALLHALQPSSGKPPDCTQAKVLCAGAVDHFRAALAVDPDNPIVLMNSGWAAQATGDDATATGLLSHAVRSDPTLFPAFNDLAVLAVRAGQPEAAARHFERAIALNPHYDLALWNLGVLSMETPGGIPRGQALLARAIAANPQLKGEPADYLTDQRIYTVAVSSGAKAFNTSYSLGMAVVGSVGLLALVGVGLGELGKERGREFVADTLERAEAQWSGLWARLLPTRGRQLILSPAATLALLLLITVVVSMWTTAAPPLTTAIIAAFAAAFAVVTHEAGHLLAARAVRRQVRRSSSPVGLVIALLMIPFRLIGGPYLGHQVVDDGAAAAQDGATTANRRGDTLVYAAGPLANVLVAAVMMVLLLIHPLPLFRVVLLVQLGMLSFSLLPIPPMEGAALTKRHPRVVGVALVALVILGVLFGEGIL
jgi:tetratricopeptide (TPR) repeat protein/Zn-dependent protease